MNINNKLLLSVTEVASTMGVSRSHVYRLKNQGKLPLPLRVGRSIRWRQAELVAWIEAGMPPLLKWKQIQGVGK